MLARLTRRQCRELYLKPAAERAKATKGDGKGKPAAPGWDWDSGLPPREEFVIQLVQMQGLTPEAAGAMWDNMKAAEERDGKG